MAPGRREVWRARRRIQVKSSQRGLIKSSQLFIKLHNARRRLYTCTGKCSPYLHKLLINLVEKYCCVLSPLHEHWGNSFKRSVAPYAKITPQQPYEFEGFFVGGGRPPCSVEVLAKCSRSSQRGGRGPKGGRESPPDPPSLVGDGGISVVSYSNRCSFLLTAFCCILVHFDAFSKISLHSILLHS